MINLNIKILLLFCILIVSSCTWEDETPTTTYDLFYVERNGAQMPIHIHGNIESKTFIFVLHGGPGGNGLLYRPGVFQESLEKEYAIVYIDQRGQGMSQGHLKVSETTVEEMVEDINAITAVVKHKYGSNNSLFLLGHSWGGTLGTAYLSTQNYQDNFKGWIEVDGAHDFNLLIKSQYRLVNKIGSEEIAQDRDNNFWKEFISNMSEVDTNNITNKNIGDLNSYAYDAEEKLSDAGLIRDGTSDFINFASFTKTFLFSVNPLTSFVSGTFTNRTLILDHDLFKTDFSQHLESIRIPTLLLWGKYDFVVPAELGDQALELINTVEKSLVIFESSGHSPMFSEGQKFSDEIIGFVEKYK